MENFISLFIDVLVYVLFIQYVVYDLMKWTVDKTSTFKVIFFFLTAATLIGTAAYYYL